MAATVDEGPAAVAQAPASEVIETLAADVTQQQQPAAKQAAAPRRILMFRQLPKLGRAKQQASSTEQPAKDVKLPQQQDVVAQLPQNAAAAATTNASTLNDIPTKFALEDDVGMKDLRGVSPHVSKSELRHEEHPAETQPAVAEVVESEPQPKGKKASKAQVKPAARRPNILQRVRAMWANRGGRMDKESAQVPAALPAGSAIEDNATNSNTHITIDATRPATEWIEELDQSAQDIIQEKDQQEGSPAQADQHHDIQAEHHKSNPNAPSPSTQSEQQHAAAHESDSAPTQKIEIINLEESNESHLAEVEHSKTSQPASASADNRQTSRAASVASEQGHTSSPLSVTGDLVHTSRPASVALEHAHASRQASGTEEHIHSSMPTSATAEHVHASQPASVVAEHASKPAPVGIEHALASRQASGTSEHAYTLRPPSATAEHLYASRPASVAVEHAHTSRPASGTAEHGYTSRPTSAKMSRPTSARKSVIVIHDDTDDVPKLAVNETAAEGQAVLGEKSSA